MVHQTMASFFSRFKYSFDFVRALFVYKNNISALNYLKVKKSEKNWIRHSNISHNAPHLPPPPHPPPNFVYALFSISLGTAVIPRRNEKQRLCKIWGRK